MLHFRPFWGEGAERASNGARGIVVVVGVVELRDALIRRARILGRSIPQGRGPLRLVPKVCAPLPSLRPLPPPPPPPPPRRLRQLRSLSSSSSSSSSSSLVLEHLDVYLDLGGLFFGVRVFWVKRGWGSARN